MSTERLHSCEGENQRSDQPSARRDASTSNGRICDYVRHRSQLYDQQQQAELQSIGKGIMTVEMQNQHAQDQQERRNNNNRKARQVIEQRDGKTSSQSEIRLGYQEGMRGVIDTNATIAIIRIHIAKMQEHHKNGAGHDKYNKSCERAKKYLKKFKKHYSGQIDKGKLHREYEYSGNESSDFMRLYDSLGQ